MKGDTIQYIYTNSQHNNLLCRVVPIELHAEDHLSYDTEKYREMIFCSETVPGFFGFDRSAYSDFKKKKGRRKWYDDLRDETTRDIQTETME